MAKYRKSLPQLGGKLFLSDGGVEATLIFHHGFALPDFAAFHLLASPEGVAALRNYYHSYARVAWQYGTGFILESPTWRASRDWGARLGYSREALGEINRKAIGMLGDIRQAYESMLTPMVISGCMGPREESYLPGNTMSREEAEAYHLEQIETFADSPADMVCALTLTYAEEATGIVQAASRAGMPVAISFTLDSEGRLPSGQSLAAAISEVDAATSAYASYYMINCAYPMHIEKVAADEGVPLQRIRGIRANTFRNNHVAPSGGTVIDPGTPAEVGGQYAALKKRLPWLNVMGGCCGTDHRHLEQIAMACTPLFH